MLSRRRLMLIGSFMTAGLLAVVSPALGISQAERSPAARPSPSFSQSDEFGNPNQDSGYLVQKPGAQIQKAKLQVVLPDFYAHGFLSTCFASATDDGVTNFHATPRCKALLGLPLPSAYQNPNHTLLGANIDLYVVSSPGPDPTYGIFPTVRVKALVFGSIPVAATVHLSQTATGKYLDPLTAEYELLSAPSDSGSASYPGLPPVPDPTAQSAIYGPPDLIIKTTIRGTVNLRLSDITVDGNPVPVGADCGPRQPSLINVRSPQGYIIQVPGAPLPPRGTAGALRPGKPAGYLDGNITIPQFANCKHGNEDLSPILSAFLSGSNNALSGYLPNGLAEDTNSFWCNTPVAHCTAKQARFEARARKLFKLARTIHDPKLLLKALKANRVPEVDRPRVPASR